MIRRLSILGCALLLASCGGGESPSNEAAPPVPVENISAPEPDNEAASTAAPAADPAAGMEEALIPAAFHGTWAESEAACAARGHVSRLVISGDTLRFYESVATVRRIERLGPREINIYVTATGEGTTRPAEYHYFLDPPGNTLTDGGGGGMVRRRCP